MITTPEPHPDLLQALQAAKQITRGGLQAADTASMDSMWEALESGKSREEAETIFSNTYLKFLYGK